MINEIIKKLSESNVNIYNFAISDEELKKVKECIIYTYSPTATSNRFQLEIRIIANNLERCLIIKKNIEDLFLGIGDKVNLKKCTSVSFAGGGSMPDRENNKVHLFFYMNFIGRR